MISRAIRPYPIEPIIGDAQINHPLAEALLASVADYRDPLQGRRIWLACSGGRDSLALAALCLQLYRQGKLPFLPQLLHVDHGLQAESSHWAQHVALWAQAQKMPCHILRAQVNGHDEQAARQARYQIMRTYLNQDDVLLLAHHADDQAETVLMRLIQGAGVKGLSGMQAWRVQSQGKHRHVLWRPWLTVRRATISAYAKRLNLPYIDDPTNESGDNVRSGLRREVLPALAHYNATVIDNIARSAQLLADAQATVTAQAEQDWQQTAIGSLCYPPAQRVLDIDKLHTLPIYRQRQLLHYWLAQDEPLPPSKQLIDDVLILTQRHDSNHQTQLYWQGRQQAYSIRRYRQQLYRLSQPFIEWLTLPIVEHTQTLSDSTSLEIIIRTESSYTWQLQFAPHTVAPLLSHLKLLLAPHDLSSELSALISNKDKIILKIAPLGRQQRVQTALATRPQSGKKLSQTLSIPVWLRDSLVVVSAVTMEPDTELPILLLSPFNHWLLGIDKSVVDVTNIRLDNSVNNRLQVHDLPA